MEEKLRTPCRECPFSPKVPQGCTGGSHPSVYIGQAQGPFTLSCHMPEAYKQDQRDLNNLQCAGAAIYRANVGVAARMPQMFLSLPADKELAFPGPVELLMHHLGWDREKAETFLSKWPPNLLLEKELSKSGCTVTLVPRG